MGRRQVMQRLSSGSCKLTAATRYLGEEAGATEAARRHGFDLRITSGEGDVNKQIEAFENLVNEGVDAIAVNFIDVEAFGPAMQKAQEAGIPVVCLHSETDGCAAVLGFDEWATGRSVGDYSVEILQDAACWPDCEAANLQGLLGQGLNEARSGGWKENIEAGGFEVGDIDIAVTVVGHLAGHEGRATE